MIELFLDKYQPEQDKEKKYSIIDDITSYIFDTHESEISNFLEDIQTNNNSYMQLLFPIGMFPGIDSSEEFVVNFIRVHESDINGKHILGKIYLYFDDNYASYAKHPQVLLPYIRRTLKHELIHLYQFYQDEKHKESKINKRYDDKIKKAIHLLKQSPSMDDELFYYWKPFEMEAFINEMCDELRMNFISDAEMFDGFLEDLFDETDHIQILDFLEEYGSNKMQFYKFLFDEMIYDIPVIAKLRKKFWKYLITNLTIAFNDKENKKYILDRGPFDGFLFKLIKEECMITNFLMLMEETNPIELFVDYIMFHVEDEIKALSNDLAMKHGGVFTSTWPYDTIVDGKFNYGMSGKRFALKIVAGNKFGFEWKDDTLMIYINEEFASKGSLEPFEDLLRKALNKIYSI